jgi:inner membrane protein
MNEDNILKKSASMIKNSVSFKIITIFFLILILFIPLSMVKDLIREREYRKENVIEEIASKWGRDQTVAGPVLTVPYKKYFEDKNGTRRFSVQYMHFLPEHLDVSGKIYPEIRYRGIYEAVLYNAKLEIKGRFAHPEFEALGIRKEEIIESGAFISVGISDMKGIKELTDARINNEPLSMNPGIETNDVLKSGISAKISVPPEGEQTGFHFALSLNGSHQIYFIPLGQITTVDLSSAWASPSFDGAFLPAERQVGDQGFQAKWNILHLNRNYPQYWIGTRHQVQDSGFGVKLFVPVNVYQKSTRTAKYALMFMVFTFMAFFFSEVMNRIKIHPIQYLLSGFAIAVFYTLLLSISEHLNFDIAYLISSIAVILLIAVYSGSILKNIYLSFMVGGILTVLYAYMYIVLQLEDYALLIGSIGLFVALGAVMFMTRKIDWYAVRMES